MWAEVCPNPPSLNPGSALNLGFHYYLIRGKFPMRQNADLLKMLSFAVSKIKTNISRGLDA